VFMSVVAEKGADPRGTKKKKRARV
jgi:hypothetical protein